MDRNPQIGEYSAHICTAVVRLLKAVLKLVGIRCIGHPELSSFSRACTLGGRGSRAAVRFLIVSFMVHCDFEK